MASAIFAILDDIAMLMDDVAIASKVAVKKTAGILGDDLAVNAEKATGFLSSREIPVLWQITKGSLINKVIIIPVVLLLNFYFPLAITIILIFGGFYLAYEGMEKIVHYFFSKEKQTEVKTETVKQLIESQQNDTDLEKSKIKSAVTTDFILSVEIVIIALSTVINEELPIQIITVSIIAVLATVGVYGLVALIVRMDDAGYKLLKKSKGEGIGAHLGRLLVKSLPVVIKALSVIGTIALILVAGGIFMHNIPNLHHVLPSVPSIIRETLAGIVGGLIAIPIVTLLKKIIPSKNQQAH